jgi:hypothetical protein
MGRRGHGRACWRLGQASTRRDQHHRRRENDCGARARQCHGSRFLAQRRRAVYPNWPRIPIFSRLFTGTFAARGYVPWLHAASLARLRLRPARGSASLERISDNAALTRGRS